MTRSNIYLDFNATTPISPLVRERLMDWSDYWGNPSSIHAHGRGPKKLMRESRRGIADSFGCHPLEIVFTGSGSEANNLGIQGFLKEYLKKEPQRKKILIGAVEHPSVLKQEGYLLELGYEVIKIPVSIDGIYNMDFYSQAVDENTALVSVMLANNELGIVAPIKKMAEMAHEKGAYFHSDCVQALGKMEFELKDLDIDLASFSSHKVYALKGAGILFVKKGTPLSPIIYGGAQERYRRAGTENLLAIASFWHMIKNLKTKEFMDNISSLRNKMEADLQLRIPGLKILCDGVERLPNTTTLFIEGVGAESMLMNLDIKGFSVGTGAACSSGNPEPSPVLLAIGLKRSQAQSSLRISLGQTTTKEQVESFVNVLCEVVEHLRHLNQSGAVNGSV